MPKKLEVSKWNPWPVLSLDLGDFGPKGRIAPIFQDQVFELWPLFSSLPKSGTARTSERLIIHKTNIGLQSYY